MKNESGREKHPAVYIGVIAILIANIVDLYRTYQHPSSEGWAVFVIGLLVWLYLVWRWIIKPN